MRNNIKTFFRSLQKRKAISLITIGGNAISMAVLFILVSFIVSEKRINKDFEKKDTIYRIKRTTIQPINSKAGDPGNNKTPDNQRQPYLRRSGRMLDFGTSNQSPL